MWILVPLNLVPTLLTKIGFKVKKHAVGSIEHYKEFLVYQNNITVLIITTLSI
jgi:hypothetical protein